MPRGIYKRTIYCSKRYQIGTEKEIFWKRVNKNGPIHPVLQTNCWIWIGSLYKKTNYGQYKGKRAHRVSYTLEVGSIPEGMFVLHKCDNPSCVRPDHLFIGTAQDNMDDKVRKGRQGNSGTKTPPIGEKNVKAKLTELQVILIRHDLEDGHSYKYLAEVNRVSETCISYIHRRKTWRHI